MNTSSNAFLGLRMVLGWTYFSAFYRRLILMDKLDPEGAGYIGIKFNYFLPNALGIKPLIRYLVENPGLLEINMWVFTLVEALAGLLLIVGLFTRLAALVAAGLAMGILLGSGWLGTTCLDEWQIGILGVSAGLGLFFFGGGHFSLDRQLALSEHPLNLPRWSRWLGQRPQSLFVGAFCLLLALLTNQVFHGGLWGPLHNKSKHPQVEIREARVAQDSLQLRLMRVQGPDTYGSYLVGIRLLGEQGQTLRHYDQQTLANLPKAAIRNQYVAHIRPGANALILPLGALGRISLPYQGPPPARVVLEDISGATWSRTL